MLVRNVATSVLVVVPAVPGKFPPPLLQFAFDPFGIQAPFFGATSHVAEPPFALAEFTTPNAVARAASTKQPALRPTW